MLGCAESEMVRLISREITFAEFQPIWSRYLNITDGRTRTDRQTTCLGNTALRTASRGKNDVAKFLFFVHVSVTVGQQSCQLSFVFSNVTWHIRDNLKVPLFSPAAAYSLHHSQLHPQGRLSTDCYTEHNDTQPRTQSRLHGYTQSNQGTGQCMRTCTSNCAALSEVYYRTSTLHLSK